MAFTQCFLSFSSAMWKQSSPVRLEKGNQWQKRAETCAQNCDNQIVMNVNEHVIDRLLSGFTCASRFAFEVSVETRNDKLQTHWESKIKRDSLTNRYRPATNFHCPPEASNNILSTGNGNLIYWQARAAMELQLKSFPYLIQHRAFTWNAFYAIKAHERKSDARSKAWEITPKKKTFH